MADLKVFIRNFVNELPKNRQKDRPIIQLEFWDSFTSNFHARIDIYRIESLKILWYRWSNDNKSKPLRDWPLSDNEFKVVNIIPPPMRSIVEKENSSLAVIQVRHV